MEPSKNTWKSRILLFSEKKEEGDLWAKGLTLAGWDVLCVYDAMETFASVKYQGVDLVLLHMAVGDSIDMDMVHVLRSVSPAEYLPVIIVAPNAETKHRCEYLDSGADEVLSNQSSLAEVISRIRALLRIKELNDQLACSRAALQQSLERERKLLSKLRLDNAHLQTLCTTDPLTHVQNVRAFRNILNHEFNAAKRYNHPLSVLMMDIDHFKLINDNYGHPAGDYVLKELAVILKKSVRDSDVVARTGGEEFAIILPRASREQAMQFAERIRVKVFRRKFIVHGEYIHVTISIGASTWPEDAEITDPEMLVYFADQALLHAKDTGRDRTVSVDTLCPVTRIRMRKQYCLSSKEVAQVQDEEDLEALIWPQNENGLQEIPKPVQ